MRRGRHPADRSLARLSSSLVPPAGDQLVGEAEVIREFGESRPKPAKDSGPQGVLELRSADEPVSGGHQGEP